MEDADIGFGVSMRVLDRGGIFEQNQLERKYLESFSECGVLPRNI